MYDFILAVVSNEATRVFCFPTAARFHYALAQLRHIRHVKQRHSSVSGFLGPVSWNLTHALPFLISFVNGTWGFMRTAVVGALEETKDLQSVVAIKQSQCVTLILKFFSFLFFFASLPCTSFEFTNGLSTFRKMLSIESLAKLWISHNQVHCRELHCKDSIGLKF